MTARTLPPLYLVTNRHQTLERPLQRVIHDTLQAGAKFIQLREKDLSSRDLLSLARAIRSETEPYNALLVINDRADIAKGIGADGVHLRSDSLPVQHVRNFLGPNAVVGKSTHSLDEVLAAEAEGGDFVVLGPIYDTPSKRAHGPPLGLRRLAEATRQCRIPIYAIGGITPERVRELKDAGAYGVAVISAILESPTVDALTHRFLDALDTRM